MNLIIARAGNSPFKISSRSWATFSILMPKFKVNYWLAKYQLSQSKLDEIGLEKTLIEDTRGTITLSLRGKLNRSRSMQIQKALMAALFCHSNVEFSLKEISSIDTSGLAILINLLREAKLLNKDFRLTDADVRLVKIFALNRIDRVFNLVS